MNRIYKYGMTKRPFGLGEQPLKGILEIAEDPAGDYFNILYYTRMLTKKEVGEYSLVYLGEAERV